MTMDLTNKNELISYLKQNGLWAKKSLGQNFLVDRGVLDKIVTAADLKLSDLVLEIGPGVGALTEELVIKAGRVVAIEKDEKLANLLELRIKNSELSIDAEIICEDALEFDPESIIKGSLDSSQNLRVARDDKGKGTDLMQESLESETLNLEPVPYKLVANIPYYITSKILEKFLTADNKPVLIVLLVQKEVAERVCAKNGDLSLLGVSVQYYGDPEIVDIVKRDSFFPVPTVDSAIIKISNIKYQKSKIDEKNFFKIVKAGFRARRKTLFNNLKAGTNLSSGQTIELLDKMNIGRNARAQELTIEQWVMLAREIENSQY
ncbi:MAG: Ribosomal RNA small subunit methyltransferase A [bacterium ADurb.Bin212]|nr:MAG: Ribosomal RNA small subunit methyltransferase A [bacterium ADurb.Bin212]